MIGRSRATLALVATTLGIALAASAAESPVLDVDGMTFVSSRANRNELVLRAERARFDTDAERAYLEQVQAVVNAANDAGASFEMTCDRGELDLDSNDFSAEGNVRGQTQSGRRFSAPWVRYDDAKGLLFTDARVLITEDAITYEGGGFRYNVRDRSFKLMGGARVVQKP